MSYSSRRPRLFVPRNELFVPNMLGNVMTIAANGLAVSATTNRAYYLPFSAPYDTAVKSIAFSTTSTTNNYDLGLYDSAGTRLGSLGSTAIGSAGVKVWTPSTPIGVAADTQYFAAFASNAATTVYGSSGATRAFFILIQASAFALPSSWTTPTTPISGLGAPFPILRITFSG